MEIDFDAFIREDEVANAIATFSIANSNHSSLIMKSLIIENIISTTNFRIDETTTRIPPMKFFQITNIDAIIMNQPDTTSSIPRKRASTEEKGKGKIEIYFDRSNMTPNDLTRPTPNRKCSTNKSTIIAISREILFKNSNPKDTIQTTFTQHYNKSNVVHSSILTINKTFTNTSAPTISCPTSSPSSCSQLTSLFTLHFNGSKHHEHFTQ